jgi:purine-binding chemotaxis protein CheW
MGQTSQFCTFFLDGLLFGVALGHVQEVLPYCGMTRVPLSTAAIGGLINLRGQIIIAIDLRRCLELESLSRDARPMSLVVQYEGSAVSLLVDQVGDIVEVREETFEPPPETMRRNVRALILGVHKMCDRLMHVVDLEHICQITGDPVGLSAG